LLAGLHDRSEYRGQVQSRFELYQMLIIRGRIDLNSRSVPGERRATWLEFLRGTLVGHA